MWQQSNCKASRDKNTMTIENEWEDSIDDSKRRIEISTKLSDVLHFHCGWEWGYSIKGSFKTSLPPNVIFPPARQGIQKCFKMDELLSHAGMEEVFYELVTRGLWEPFFRIWLDNREEDPFFFEEGPPLHIGILTFYAFMGDQEGKAVAARQALIENARKES